MTDPFGTLPPAEQMQIARQCASKACSDARNKVITARNDAAAACSTIKRLEHERASYTGVMGALIAVLAALIVAAIKAPWPVNLVFWILATLASIALIVVIVLLALNQSQLSAAKASFTNATLTFTNGVTEVQANCNAFCPPLDTTMPTCL